MLKVMTLNVNLYEENHGVWPRRRRLIQDGVRESGTDVLALQAVRRHRSVERGLDQGAQLAADLDGFAHRAFRPAMLQQDGSEDGLGVLSKRRLGDVEQRELTTLPGTEDGATRIAIRTTVNTALGEVGLVNAHLSWVPEQNARNVEEVLAFVAEHAGPQLLVGDFNAAPDSAGIRRLAEHGLVDVWARLRPGQAGPTFESHKPEKRIDYVWVTADLQDRLEDVQRVCDKGEGGVRASNHCGVAVTLAI